MARLSKVSSKNQVTLPKEIMGRYPGISYFEIRDAGAEIVLAPVKTVPADRNGKAQKTLAKVRQHFSERGLTEKEVDDAVAWARARRKR